jgi:putative cell wall-binding protein
MTSKIRKKVFAIFLMSCMVLSTLIVGPFQPINVMADTTASTAPNANAITIDNYIAGINDKVIVTGLTSGDIVNVYDAASGGNLIGTAPESNGAATVTIQQLQTTTTVANNDTIYVTVTSLGYSESDRTAKTFTEEPIPWQVYDHTGNWGEDANIARTGITSAKYPAYPVDSNGNSDDNPLGIQYNKHIIIKNNGSRITFYGYGQPAYKDFIFLPSGSTSQKTFTFNMDISKISYHSMEGAGFLFNSKIESNLLSGYLILFTGGVNSDGYTEDSTQRKIKLYKIENVNVNTLHDCQNGSISGYSGITQLDPTGNGTVIKPSSGDTHSITLTVSPSNVTMSDNGNTLINNYTLPKTYGYGLGLLASYNSHSCSMLSYFTITKVCISDVARNQYPWPILDLSGQPDNGAASLTYTAPTGADVVVVQQSTDGTNYVTAKTAETLTTTSSSTKVVELTNGQQYYFRLLVGGGDNAGISNVATVTPKLMIGDLTAVGADKQVNLTFTAPEGATSVILKYSTDGTTYTPATTSDPLTFASTTATVTGLTNGQKYFFKLVITGGTYAGDSNIAIATPTNLSVPDAPTNVSATAGNTNALLTWTAPANDGGSPITDYLVNVYSNGSSVKTVDTGSTTPSATVVDLANGTPYTFTVNAQNSVGYSTTSSATSVVIPTAPAGVPDAPTNVAATAGNASASLTWTAPANDGGSPITDYLIDVYSNGSSVNTVDTTSTTPSATVVNLTNGIPYTFDVKAVNSVGVGTTSSATSIVTPTAPHEPTHSSGSGTGSTSTSTSPGPTITANVVDGTNNSTPIASVNAKVTANADGTDTVTVKPSDAIVMKQPDGTSTPFEDYSKIGYEAPSNAPVTINSDGTVEVNNLTKGSSYDIPVTYDMGNGQKITIGNMHISVDSAGNVNMTSDLIDPYGTLTDSLSGNVISGANVTLYYADTARNKSAGKTPNTIVQLPTINGFKPNNNANPQTTDSNGAYGFMVYPNTDYYVVVTKDGYDTFTSPTISVATELVEFSAKLNPPVTGVKRIAGTTRVDTAIELAKSEFTGKVNSIIFATAGNYPDALTGSVLAYQQKAPILLVGDSQEDQDKVLTYMKNYLVTNGKVFLLGGTGVVTENFADQVKTAGYSNIIRLGGADRYETAAKIADYLNVAEGTPVVIASGENYPDALSVSSAAAVNQYPILLVTNNTISDSVKSKLEKIKPSKVYIIGEQGAISDALENEVAQLTSLDSNSIVRLGGADRYSTSVAVANNFKLSGKSACIATGTNFPDALAGSIYAANYNAPIILVGSTLTDEEKAYIQNSNLSGATIFGGQGAVNDEVQNEVTVLLK